jgi:gliding motility-associated-like protein
MLIISCYGQQGAKILFEENKSQWPAAVQYKADVQGARIFLEKNRFTFLAVNEQDLERLHDAREKGGEQEQMKDSLVRLHAFRANFTGSSENVNITRGKQSDFYSNYFIGNDKAKWASEVHSFESITYQSLYPGIDLLAYSENDRFKYDFVIGKGGDPGRIRIRYEGADKVALKNDRLVISTTAGTIEESIPLAYQVIGNSHKKIGCRYELSKDGNTVSFVLPEGYDPEYKLVIDPVLVAATFCGGTAMTYGHSATYDRLGNIYTGSECFNVGYPTTPGAFQVTFASGGTDIAISKLNPNGSSLLWATYLGGSGTESPNSLVVNDALEIYVLGISNSPNYPVSAGCYDNTQNGMQDIVVTHLDAAGGSLVGSTYVGGNQNDGRWTGYAMNGHDGLRGEIIVDQSDNAWISSYTASVNFPVTPGAYDQTQNGGYDACAFRLSPTLSTLQWSTFLGGPSDDLGYGLRLNNAGELYMTGLTQSGGFPVTAGAYTPAFQGGGIDGYVAKFDAGGSVLLACSFIGTNAQDVSYFIALDINQDPYLFGTSMGAMPVSPGVYSNSGGGNFIIKLDTALSSAVFSTIVGAPLAGYLEPEAFMVDTCGNIYLAGFGSSGTYPVTPTALYTSPPGTCYLMTLSKDAASLLYGSFYYGSHVDGGTSRFDPTGTIYLGICMGGSAPVPSWAYSNGIPDNPWDMFVLKMDFEMDGVNAAASVSPNDTICIGQAVTFTNLSNGLTYLWDFGDSSPTSTGVNPTHVYASAGSYNVLLYAYDPASCNLEDSASLVITVLPLPSADAGNDTSACTGPVQLNASGGLNYSWSPAAGLSNPNIANPVATPAGTTTYTVTVSNGACTDTDEVTVFTEAAISVSSGQTICRGDSAALSASGGISYAWSPSAGLSDPSSANPGASPAATTTYTVVVTNVNGCTGTGTVTVVVNPVISTPLFGIAEAPPFDIGMVLNFIDSSAGSFSWYWSFGDNSYSAMQNPQHAYPTAGTYLVCHYADFPGAGCIDTVCRTVEVIEFDILVPNVITPNGDGHNDYLVFQYLEHYPGSRIEIYDRWGLKLYESDNYLNDWSGSNYSDGVYYFILYQHKNDSYVSIPGFFHLMRN